MALTIITFVPEGIVVASDGLSEIRNKKNDQTFFHKRQRRLFSYQDKFMICLHGSGYIKGLPYAFYINKVFSLLQTEQYKNVKDFAVDFRKEISNYMESEEILSFYAIGIDKGDNGERIPVVILLDNNNMTMINCGYDNHIVYNYHAIGHNLWLNKLLLPTFFIDNGGGKTEFENVDIDFSKYSIDDAIDFSKNIIFISREMDNIAQLKQMIGDNVYIGVLFLDGSIEIKQI